MSSQNEMKLIFDARSVNESFARVAVAAFIAELNPTLDEIADIKTAVSESGDEMRSFMVTMNRNRKWNSCVRFVGMRFPSPFRIQEQALRMCQKRWNLFYTTKPELERSGMGFSFMEAFMDRLEVVIRAGKRDKRTYGKKTRKSGRLAYGATGGTDQTGTGWG